MRTQADEETLRERLLEIADDHNWPGYARIEAKSATYDLADFTEVRDLADKTLLEALRQRVLARADRPGRSDDLESLRRRLDPQ